MIRGKRGRYKPKKEDEIKLNKYYEKVKRENNGKRDIREDLVG